MTSQSRVPNPVREASRLQARRRLDDLMALVQKVPGLDGASDLLVEAEGLRRAIEAFHLEGIRFRMYTLDRRVQRLADSLPAAGGILADVRTALEAAGIHTRSH